VVEGASCLVGVFFQSLQGLATWCGALCGGSVLGLIPSCVGVVWVIELGRFQLDCDVAGVVALFVVSQWVGISAGGGLGLPDPAVG
jgi:hypothetical protein